jgi:pimeloyl-ACP methyl ester carboxylesterase
MSGTTTTEVRTIDVLDGPRATTTYVGGSGPALLYLHSEERAGWNDLLEHLAGSFTVYAPVVAGTEDALATIDGLHDLIVYLLDVIDALELRRVPVVGESFGAMVAAELAAVATDRVSKLALLAPIGLWRDDVPVPDLYAVPPETQATRLFGDPSSDAAQRWIASLTDKAAFVDRMRAMRTALHFVFPIADIGLTRRLHRVVAPTLLVWGDRDGVVPPVYADEFASRLASSTTHLIAGAGHCLSADAATAADAAGAIEAFLAS